jgi:hypothetical protein
MVFLYISSPFPILLSRTYCLLQPRSFLSILPSWRAPAVRVPRSTLALNQFFLMTPLLHLATLALRIIFLPATLNFLRDPQFPWV